MKIDFQDVFASGIGFLLLRMVLLALAIWTGCFIGGAALMAGELIDSNFRVIHIEFLSGSPMRLLTMWIIPNVLFLGIASYWFIRAESSAYISWGVLVVVEALIVVAGSIGRLMDGWIPISVTWITCVTICVMLGYALWFLRQWQMNRWAVELAMLKTENAIRRADLKSQYGTASVGNDEWSLD